MWSYLVDAFSGPAAVFMYAIVAVGAYAIAIALERFVWLYLRWRPRVPAVLSALDRGDAPAAVEAAGDTPLGDVLSAGLAQSVPDAAWEAMTAAGVEADAAIRVRVSYLATVGNIATMLGLLGTVYGLILAFAALGDTGAGERAVGLSQGISAAMSTTAAGLTVGIFALAIHAALAARVRAKIAALEIVAGRVALLIRRGSA